MQPAFEQPADQLLPVDVSGLTVSLAEAPERHPIVQDVSFQVRPGEVLGLVGESGCGKTTTALSLLGYWPASLRSSGSVLLSGRQVVGSPLQVLRSLRGRVVSYVPQNPTSALNPARRIGAVFTELLLEHGSASSVTTARSQALAALCGVALADAETVLDRYPHQLSGGQQQRVAIAMAIACEPAVIVLDEPTTGLDASTQKSLLQLLRTIRDRRSVAMVYVTHDLNVLREIASHIAVMYAGIICEIGPLPVVFSHSRHPYTRALLAAAPDIAAPDRQKSALEGVLQRSQLSSGCLFSHRCPFAVASCRHQRQHLTTVEGGHSVACQRWDRIEPEADMPVNRAPRSSAMGAPILAVDRLVIAYHHAGVLSVRTRHPVKVVDDVSFALRPGEIVALVGESGSGKSTIAKALSGSLAAHQGQIEFDGGPLPGVVRDRTADQRRRIQLIFQNPDASLNPRRRVGEILGGALQSFYRLSGEQRRQRARQALTEVQLPLAYMDRFPPQLSGGERQRVAIARALIVNPDVLLCDEILSALDVSVQAGILNLLNELVETRGLTILFISHDLSVVRSVADRVLVLYRGCLVESGPAVDVFDAPFHPYLFSLLAALPGQPFVASTLSDEERSAGGPYPGTLCTYLDRCSFAQESLCTRAPPPLQTVGAKQLLCHLRPAELAAKGYRANRTTAPTEEDASWTLLRTKD